MCSLDKTPMELTLDGFELTNLALAWKLQKHCKALLPQSRRVPWSYLSLSLRILNPSTVSSAISARWSAKLSAHRVSMGGAQEEPGERAGPRGGGANSRRGPEGCGAWPCGEAWPRLGIFDRNGRSTEGWGPHRGKVGERCQN